MKKIDKYIYILLIAAVLLFFYSCKGKPVEVPLAVPETVVTFVSGEVYIADSSGEKNEAEIGEKLFPDYEIITMQDSFLEFNIGRSGIIRMGPDTVLSLSDLTEKGEGEFSSIDVTLSVTAGSVMQKVKKLAGGDSYNIRTASAAFGVRGTEFLVETDGESDLLAVKSGSVIASLYPEYLEKLEEKALSGDAEYLKLYTEIENSFPLLEAGEQISIDKEALSKGGELLKEINNLIDKADAGEIQKEYAVSSITESIIAAAEAVAASGIESVPVSPEKGKILQYTDSFILEEKAPDSELYIKTEPAGAAVYFDGNLAGYSSLKALFSGDRVINLRVEKEGYYPFEEKITAGEVKGSPYIIKLERISGSLSISAVPEDSVITVDGGETFKGKYSGFFDPGSSVSITVSRNEYETENLVYSIKEGTSISERIVLNPMLILFSFDSGLESAARLIRAEKDNLLSAGTDSNFSFFSKKGVKRWSNSISYQGRPLLSGENLLFVSGQRLENTDILTGAGKGGIDIEYSLYQDPQVFDGSVFINSGSSVLKVNPDSLEVERSYTLPDPAVSNPYFINGRMLSVTDKGVLHIYGKGEVADSSISVARGNPGGVDITVSGEKGYFADRKGGIYSLNLSTGKFLWEKSFKTEGDMPEISIRDEKILLFSGKTLSIFNTDGEILYEPISNIKAYTFTSSGELFHASEGGVIAVRDFKDGSILRRGTIEGNITDLTVSGNRIYAVKDDGVILALNPDALK